MSRRVRRRVASCVAASFVPALGTPVRPVPVAAAAAVPVGVPRHEESPALARTVRNLRSNIKYVFALYQENRSFDFYFGSYPGAMGLFSQPLKDTAGYHQPIENTDGSMTTLSPFRIDGPRVPLIVISPFAKTGTISHDMGDQASVVKLVDNVFGVEPLASLPDEARARKDELREFGQSSLGPYDGNERDITTLLSAFDEKRLAGLRPLLPGSYATIPQNLVLNLAAATGYGCKTLGVVPTDIQLGLNDVPPADFNPRPGTDPPANASRRKVSTQSIDD